MFFPVNFGYFGSVRLLMKTGLNLVKIGLNVVTSRYSKEKKKSVNRNRTTKFLVRFGLVISVSVFNPICIKKIIS